MLAGVRFRFLFSFWLALFGAACLPVRAQINGVPPSVTSIGFGGRLINGVRPSVTSLGPNGSLPLLGLPPVGPSFFEGCCSSFFFPANPLAPQNPTRRHRDLKDPSILAVGVVEPVYIPYAAPDGEESDDAPEADAVHAPGARNPDRPSRRAEDRDASDSAPRADTAARPEDPVATEPPVTQPPTVLIFKDGHKSDVVNYAIVGDTLFDFGEGRTHKILLADLDLPATHKANDDRGVDFQIPATNARQ